jgi:hypothetical protein
MLSWCALIVEVLCCSSFCNRVLSVGRHVDPNMAVALLDSAAPEAPRPPHPGLWLIPFASPYLCTAVHSAHMYVVQYTLQPLDIQTIGCILPMRENKRL